MYIIIFIINFSCFIKSIIWKRFTSAPSFVERKQWIFSKNSRMCIFSLFLFRVVLQAHICRTHVRVYLIDIATSHLYKFTTIKLLLHYAYIWCFRIRQLLLNKIFNCLVNNGMLKWTAMTQVKSLQARILSTSFEFTSLYL